jgi:hypothetical protein
MRLLAPLLGPELAARVIAAVYVRLRVHRFVLAGRRLRRWVGVSW